jgi:UDP-arabinose 4-epimerase
MLRDFDRAHGLRSIALRYFNAAGADPAGDIGEDHTPETHLVPLALEAAAGKRGPLTVFGTDYATPDGTCIRDYIHVTDLAQAHVKALQALEQGASSGNYNLGTGTGCSVKEMIEAIEKFTGRPVPHVFGERREGDPPRLVADASLFGREFGWQASHSDLPTIIRTAWQWLNRSR